MEKLYLFSQPHRAAFTGFRVVGQLMQEAYNGFHEHVDALAAAHGTDGHVVHFVSECYNGQLHETISALLGRVDELIVLKGAEDPLRTIPALLKNRTPAIGPLDEHALKALNTLIGGKDAEQLLPRALNRIHDLLVEGRSLQAEHAENAIGTAVGPMIEELEALQSYLHHSLPATMRVLAGQGLSNGRAH